MSWLQEAGKTGTSRCDIFLKINTVKSFYFKRRIYHFSENFSPIESENSAIMDVYKKYGDSGLIIILNANNLIQHTSIYNILELQEKLLDLNCPSICHLRKKFFDKAVQKFKEIFDNKFLWKNYGKIIWSHFCLELLRTSYECFYPLDLIKIISNEYGVIEYEGFIEIYGDCFRIGLMSDVELSDCLGLPYVPGEKINLHNRVMNAIENPEIILKNVIEWNNEQLEIYKKGVKMAVEIEPVVINTENLIGDPINEYPPGQIFRTFTSNGKIYQFTLNEILRIIKNSSNPYTREHISLLDCLFVVKDRPKGHKTGTIMNMIKSIIEPECLP